MYQLTPLRHGLVALILVAATFQASAGEEPDSDRRAVDACEHTTRPRGPAHGLRAQCEARGGGGVARGDFNGDGIADLAVGAPFEDIGSVDGAGAVNVIYGSGSSGLVSAGNQFLNQGQSGSGIPGTAEPDDHFGWALASGNFDGDDFSDLAVGIPDEDFDGLTNPGQIFIFRGTSDGLVFDRFFDYRDLSPAVAADGDQFGYSLVWADFNGDTIGDLAAGVPNRDIQFTILYSCIVNGLPTMCSRLSGMSDVGAVVALYGGAGGLSTSGAQQVRQGDPVFAFNGNPYFGGQAGLAAGFGLTLTAGDYDGDGFHDLAVGAPYQTACQTDCASAAGQVHVIFGSDDRLKRDRFVLLDQGSRDGVPEVDDRFGWALASGDFNDDARADLAVGVPYEDSSVDDSGIIQVFFGAPGGLSSFEQAFSQGAGALFDGRQIGDLFGYSLAAADFNGDGRKDLAIGVPGEDVTTATKKLVVDAGVVQILYGGNGLFSCCEGPAPQVFQHIVSSISGPAADGDQFGFALSAWNFGRTAQADLAVGVPFDDLVDAAGHPIVNGGSVHVFYGSSGGLTTTGRQVWTQNNLSGSSSEPHDQFGRALY
jgi:hypothetical protein